MDTELFQRAFIFTKKFVITSRGVDFSFSLPFSKVSGSHDFEEIGAKIHTVETESVETIIFLCIIAIVIVLVLIELLNGEVKWPALFVFTCLFLITYYFRWSYKVLKSFTAIESQTVTLKLFVNSPSKEEVMAFAKKIIAARNNYLVLKYGKIDVDIPYDQLIGRFVWLRDNGLIAEETFLKLKEEASKATNKTGTIGFNLGN